MSTPLASAEKVIALGWGVQAWTTTKHAGSFGLGTSEPVDQVMSRWSALLDELETHGAYRLATATQVHGADLALHAGGWSGWLRSRGIDGHLTTTPGTALAVTIADCTPVFIAHPRGAVAVVHAGWRGTAAGILPRALAALADLGYASAECSVHLGPAICGKCYEVGPEVLEAVLGISAPTKGLLDVRAVLADQAAKASIRSISISDKCTKCNNDEFFSHRAGDPGRALGIIVCPPTLSP